MRLSELNFGDVFAFKAHPDIKYRKRHALTYENEANGHILYNWSDGEVYRHIPEDEKPQEWSLKMGDVFRFEGINGLFTVKIFGGMLRLYNITTGHYSERFAHPSYYTGSVNGITKMAVHRQTLNYEKFQSLLNNRYKNRTIKIIPSCE
ncbi:hypothetical protein [Elizabethkingia phage TCUEAP1]|nr:hypothetical protein [Elizabethkingia phage TCUEAP1]